MLIGTGPAQVAARLLDRLLQVFPSISMESPRDCNQLFYQAVTGMSYIQAPMTLPWPRPGLSQHSSSPFPKERGFTLFEEKKTAEKLCFVAEKPAGGTGKLGFKRHW